MKTTNLQDQINELSKLDVLSRSAMFLQQSDFNLDGILQ